MTRSQAEALLRATEGRICARLYRRADGTILTENCPEGLRAIGRRLTRVAGVAMSSIATMTFAAAAQFPFIQIPSALQESISSVAGIVQDVTGAGISNAEVGVTKDASGERFEIRSDSRGHFRVVKLGPGSYTIRIQAPGFASFTRQLILRPLREYNVTATLPVGSMGGPVFVEPVK